MAGGAPRDKGLQLLQDRLEQALLVAEQASGEVEALAAERDRFEAERNAARRELVEAREQLRLLQRQETARHEIAHRVDSEIAALRHRADQSQAEAGVLADELQDLMETLEATNLELAEANVALELRVAQRTAEIQASNHALRVSEERLLMAQRHAAAGIWDWDIARGEIVVSADTALLFGQRGEAVTLPLDAWLDWIAPEDRDGIAARLREPLDLASAELSIEYRVRHAVRGVRWLASKGRLVRDARSLAVRLVGMTFDITERRRMMEEARRAQQVAEEANAAKSRFLAAASHDVRQPVMAAGLFLDLLRKKALDGDARDLVDLVGTSLGGLQGMLNGLLELARLEAGVVEPSPRDFAMDDLLHRLSSEFEAQAKAARLWLQIPPTDAVVHADLLLVELILRNLISNALKFTERGGVTVECRAEAGGIRVAVSDTGIGIASDALGRIFEEFVQMPGGARDARGFGLGLATVSRVARLMGVTLDVWSEPGRGSVFSVLLSAGRDVMPELPLPAPLPAAADLKGRTVLVVEDDPDVRDAMRYLLSSWGVEVMPAHSAAAAQDMLQTKGARPDVVVADYELGDRETGLDLVAAVRRIGPIPCVLVTGNTDPDLLRTVGTERCRLLHKPASPDEIKAALIAALTAETASGAASSTAQALRAMSRAAR